MRRAVLLGALFAALILGALGGGTGCTSHPDAEAIDAALAPELAPGQPVEGWRSWSGNCRNPDRLLESGYFALKTPQELGAFWFSQVAPPAGDDAGDDAADAGARQAIPDVRWGQETVLAVALKRSAVTALTFYRLVRGDDGRYHAVFLGDTAPLTTPYYVYPYCVVRLPVADREIVIEVLYVEEFDGRTIVTNKGQQALIPLPGSPGEAPAPRRVPTENAPANPGGA